MKMIRPIDITTSGTFTRASAGTYFDKAGALQSAGHNVPRINYDPITHAMQGVLVEATATNFAKVNTTWTGVNSVTLSATGNHTLSFYGTGTIVLSGGATGTLVGSGAFPVRSTLTFNATTTSITCTVTGTVGYVQIEAGSVATSWIDTPLAGSDGIRAADVVSGTGYIYSNLTEADYPEWNAATSYTVGDYVMLGSVHKIYKNYIAGVNATSPDVDISGRWLEVSPTNRWKVFDASLSTVTSNTNTITYILKPGRVNGLALLGMSATFVEVAMTANGETVYTGSADLLTGNTVGNWYEYFYEPIYQQDALVITELIDAALLNLPAYGDGLISITVEYPSNTPTIAAIVCGLVADLGLTQYDCSLGIVDYSKVETDTFGRTTVVKRGFSKRGNFPLVVENSAVDNIARILSMYRATPIVWVATENIYNSLVVYGFYKDWEIRLTEPNASLCNLQVEGLPQ